MSQSHPILIIGAGLGGLCLAQVLKQSRIPFRVFERDSVRAFRSQGYRIRLAGEGTRALQYCLTPELWRRFEQTCAADPSQGKQLDATTGAQVGSFGPPPGSQKSYTVDRSVFRDLLLSGLDDHVSFGKDLDHYVTADDGVTACFTDASVSRGSLLVGADGVNSCVRRQHLGDFRMVAAGKSIIYGKSPLTAVLESAIRDGGLDGTSMAVETSAADGKKILLLETIRFDRGGAFQDALPQDYVYWVLLFDSFAETAGKGPRLDHKESADLSIELTQNWAHAFCEVLAGQDTSQTSMLRVSSAHPDLPAWASSARVTLLGDAIHPMPPTAGQGANTALRDSADLARRIIAAAGRVDETMIKQYEEALRDVGRKAMAASWNIGSKAFGFNPIDQCATFSI